MNLRRPSVGFVALMAFFCTLFLLLGHIAPADATRDTWDADIDDILYYIDRFAFKDDGIWNVQIDPKQKGVPLHMLMCDDGQYDDTVDGYSSSDGRDVCNKIRENRAKCAVYSFRGFGNFSGTIRSRDMYWFVLVNCNDTDLDVEFYEYFINPDDEYLGWDNIPLPYIYGLLIIVYSFLLATWILNILMIDYGAGSNRLHKYISLWPITKLFLVAFNTAYWAYLSEEGTTSIGVDVVYIVYNSLWYSYMFGGLILISLGWGITRRSIHWVEACVFGAVEVVFYVTWVINFALEGYYAVVSIFGLGAMMIVIHIFTHYNLKKVSTELKKSQSAAPASEDGSSDPAPGATHLPDIRYERGTLTLKERERVLGSFMVIHLCYVIPMIIWVIIYAGLFHYHNWAYRMLNEGTEIGLALAIGWILRLRRRNIYFEFNDGALQDWEHRATNTAASSDGQHIEMDHLPPHNPTPEAEMHTFENPDFDPSEDLPRKGDGQSTSETW